MIRLFRLINNYARTFNFAGESSGGEREYEPVMIRQARILRATICLLSTKDAVQLSMSAAGMMDMRSMDLHIRLNLKLLNHIGT
jgi:hypothetical protein